MIEHLCIYENPLDYPGKYVLRRWVTGKHYPIPDEKPIIVHEDLAEVRKHVPDGFVKIPRAPDDDRCILETWI